ncbi:uncharacterized membrane protein At3g27390 [Primulina huaijiensis]|uniref:uncharacterized membrane protein At3g27390 n=1 Tax=Primulina huaijiensis TaxID=1492673 RepID=UPI003CC7440D
MEVPVGFVAKLWIFLSFLPFFTLLLLLGLLKGLIICPVALAIIAVGNSAVVIGLWPAHVIWTYYCVTKSKRLGWILKILVLLSLPVLLILWPGVAIVGSVLGGIGYGFFAPLIATFEAVGESVTEKWKHCFLDGCWSTLEDSCTVVRDFMDFCFHSYFSYMDELSEEVHENEKPMEIQLSLLPSGFLVAILAVPVDVPLITVIALWKSPYMLFHGWKRLLEDLIGREGPFLETVCVPFAGLAIFLWPLAVIGAVLAAFFSSIFLGLYGGVIVIEEGSLQMGLAYIVAVISLFDEYCNDLLYLREGSCFPRPRYRKNKNDINEIARRQSIEQDGSHSLNLVSEGSRTLKRAIQQYTPVQVWDWLFKSCEVNGKVLLHEGLVNVEDVQECILKGNCKKLGVKLPAWSILQCLLKSSKSDSSGLVLSEHMELNPTNFPRDRFFDWFLAPLLTMKEQIKGLKLEENEEAFLKKLVMVCKNNTPEEWEDTGFPSGDKVRVAQLQAVIRRLQGIVGSMSRLPTFRRRFKNLVKVLYVEAIQMGLSSPGDTGSSKSRFPHARRKSEESSMQINTHEHDGDIV